MLQKIDGLDGVTRVQAVGQRLLRPRVGPHESPQASRPVLDDYLIRLVGERHFLADALVKRPSKLRQQLPGLLLDRHLAHQIVHTRLYRLGGILVNVLLPVLVEINPPLPIDIRVGGSVHPRRHA